MTFVHSIIQLSENLWGVFALLLSASCSWYRNPAPALSHQLGSKSNIYLGLLQGLLLGAATSDLPDSNDLMSTFLTLLRQLEVLSAPEAMRE